jgi:hypothetical protein
MKLLVPQPLHEGCQDAGDWGARAVKVGLFLDRAGLGSGFPDDTAGSSHGHLNTWKEKAQSGDVSARESGVTFRRLSNWPAGSSSSGNFS